MNTSRNALPRPPSTKLPIPSIPVGTLRQGESGAGCQIPVGSIVLRRGALRTPGANSRTGIEMGEHSRAFRGYLDLV